MKQHMLTHKIRDMPGHMFHNHSTHSQDTKSSGMLSTEEGETSNASSVDSSFNRSNSESRERQSPPRDIPLSLSRSQPTTPQSIPPPSVSPPTPTLSLPLSRRSASPPRPVSPVPPPPPPPPQAPPPSLKRSPPEDRDHSSVPLPKRHPSKHFQHPFTFQKVFRRFQVGTSLYSSYPH